MKVGEERKQRVDKKRAIAPYIEGPVYEQISRLSYICDLPLKSVGEMLAREGLRSRALIERIKRLFRRDFTVDEYHHCFGQPSNKPYRSVITTDHSRLFMRF